MAQPCDPRPRPARSLCPHKGFLSSLSPHHPSFDTPLLSWRLSPSLLTWHRSCLSVCLSGSAPLIPRSLLGGHLAGGGGEGFMSRGSALPFLASGSVPARSRAPFNFLDGATATCFLILILWQTGFTGFTGIRVGEASDPGPTILASDGVTTPPPRVSGPGTHDTSGSGPSSLSLAPPVVAHSSSRAPPDNNYISRSHTARGPSTRPSRICSFSQPRRSPSSQPFSSSGSH